MSVSIGALAGLLTWLLAKWLRGDSRLRVLTAAAAIVTMVVGLIVDAELVILGIAFGFTFANLTPDDERENLDKANAPLVAISVMLVMALIGTTLGVTAIFSLAVLVEAAIDIGLRAAGKVGGASAGARIAGSAPTVRRYLGWTLLAAAGVSLTFVASASTVLPPETAARLGGMIAAAAIVNELIAVFATTRAFRAAGEIRADGANATPE